MDKIYTIILIVCAVLFVICLTGCFVESHQIEGSVVYETDTCVITSEQSPVNEKFYIIRKYKNIDGEWECYEVQSENVNVEKTINRLIKEENS